MIDELFDRNVGWALAKTANDPGYFRRLAEQQTPRYLWLGCSDTRVPANEIVGLDPGELFVHRNVANVVHTGDMNLLSVLGFAVDVLRVDHWLAPVREMCRRRTSDLAGTAGEAARIDRACELNVGLQVQRIAATPILRAAWHRGQSGSVHGWIYGLEDGLLRDLGLRLSSLDDAASLDDRGAFERLTEPVTIVRRHAIEAFQAMTMLEPQLLEEGLGS